jgi:hypothetical protein
VRAATVARFDRAIVQIRVREAIVRGLRSGIGEKRFAHAEAC